MKQYGLIGKSLSHSFSKSFFEKYFLKNNIQAIYSNFELTDLGDVESLLNSDKSGLNVTIPYKVEIIPFLDSISPVASEVGAVNCISIKNGKSTGHNTDVFGFAQSIKPFLASHHQKALIFGNGGAAKAVTYVFDKLGIEYIYVCRNPKQGEFSFEEINQRMLAACQILVNTTPVGTAGNSDKELKIPYEHLNSNHFAIDLIYNPAKTNFLKNCEEKGAQILNGESMLIQQALKSWEIWNR